MSSPPLISSPRLAPDAGVSMAEFDSGFDQLRQELEIIEGFSPQALAEAEAGELQTERAGRAPADLRNVPFVTIDPPASMDLDQAYHAARIPDGFEVRYAIADPAAFVRPGGALDLETRARGVTMYAPDRNTPLHPRSLSEAAASLLPDRDRPAAVWTIRLDADGRVISKHFARATVRSRAKLSYRDAQLAIDRGTGPDSLDLLRTIGAARKQLEIERGGVSLNLPSQELVATNGGYELRYDESLAVEDWNAQISLLAGMCAADLMLEANVGLLRTLPPPPPETLDQIRRHGLALGVEWPDELSYQQRVRTLDAAIPDHNALLAFAVRALRGAGYLALGDQTDESTIHWAIAADYAHVTAPLRRVADRFANECLLAIGADEEPPAWALEGVLEMPEVMAGARRKERSLDRAILDFAEAMIMAPRRGERFRAVVTTERRDGLVAIQISDPAVATLLEADVEPGDEIVVTVVDADPSTRRVRLRLAEPGALSGTEGGASP